MTTITYIEQDGTEHSREVANGLSLMEGAVKGGVPGIDADCGGSCACATCHVYIDEAWIRRIGQPSDMEEEMLDCASDVTPASRLSCQIKIVSELDGLIVHLPASQR